MTMVFTWEKGGFSIGEVWKGRIFDGGGYRRELGLQRSMKSYLLILQIKY